MIEHMSISEYQALKRVPKKRGRRPPKYLREADERQQGLRKRREPFVASDDDPPIVMSHFRIKGQLGRPDSVPVGIPHMDDIKRGGRDRDRGTTAGTVSVPGLSRLDASTQ